MKSLPALRQRRPHRKLLTQDRGGGGRSRWLLDRSPTLGCRLEPRGVTSRETRLLRNAQKITRCVIASRDPFHSSDFVKIHYKTTICSLSCEIRFNASRHFFRKKPEGPGSSPRPRRGRATSAGSRRSMRSRTRSSPSKPAGCASALRSAPPRRAASGWRPPSSFRSSLCCWGTSLLGS